LAPRGSGIIASRNRETNLHLDLSVVEGEYLQDLLDQPRALQDTLDSLRFSEDLGKIATRLNNGDFRRIVLTGMGTSFYALHPLNLELIGQGLAAIMVETSELVHYQSSLIDSKTLLIAVSQSGRSAEVVRLLGINDHRAAMIAVTNAPESPLALQSDVAVLTAAGREVSVSCKTYVTALMALKWLGDILIGPSQNSKRRELQYASPAMASYLSDWRSHVQAVSERLHDVRHLFLLGRGRSLAAVGTGALIIKESDRIEAEGMSSAAFRHGPFEMLSEETFVLVFSGDAKTKDLNRRLLQDIQKHRGIAEMVSEGSATAAFRLPAAPDSILPITEILSVQMITLALAARARREPGRFELASKVTTTE